MALLLVLGLLLALSAPVGAQADDPSPPANTVKLIFIHHSCGENWLTDDDGGLGRALEANNYYVSDTNYGWGPDSIGDRTDITDWPEWFTGPSSDRYLAALYAESGQNSWYTRTLSDPGGENQVILFKSCFPNSNLEGNPHDPPARGGGLTVGNAKAIYNELLAYFATRPDKLFVAITAPPVQDPTYGTNARAFNTWLVQEWLAGYEGNNVAVFDFYNVLTDPDNHHRFRNGEIEYVTDRGGDTLYYPTNGDDHPAPAGNRKATEELVPLLNVYYHRWQGGAPAAPPTPVSEPTASEEPPSPTPEPAEAAEPPGPTPEPAEETVPLPAMQGVIDDFESESSQWEAFVDTEKDTRLTCNRDGTVSYSGSAGLHIEYDVAPESWAACALVSPAPQDWRDGQGLVVYLRGEQVGQQVLLIAYQGESSDELLHFEHRIELVQEAVDGWQRVDVPWDQFVPPSWQGTAPLDPSQAMGLALMFNAPAGERNSGHLWLDDVSFLSAVPPVAEPSGHGDEVVPAGPTETLAPEPTVTTPPSAPMDDPSAEQSAAAPEAETGGGGLCPGSAAIGLAIVGGVVWAQRAARPSRKKRI